MTISAISPLILDRSTRDRDPNDHVMIHILANVLLCPLLQFVVISS